MQAHTLGEVDILSTVLLRGSSGTILPIFIEIGSYLTDKKQKISLHSFFETRCRCLIVFLINADDNDMYRIVLRIHNLHRVSGDSYDSDDSEYSSPRHDRSARTSTGTCHLFPMVAASAVSQRQRQHATNSTPASEHH